MRNYHLLAVCAATLLMVSTTCAATIKGEYLEARTCAVYAGECFTNSEVGLAGREALLAWKVDEGSWNGVKLDGLGAALVVTSDNTLGHNDVIPLKPGKTSAVILVDDRANATQKKALVEFVKDSAKKLTKNVIKVESVPFKLENDHLSGKGLFSAGKAAEIKTRAIKSGDCVCTNEIVYYHPLTKVENYHPAFSLKHTYQGKNLDRRWSNTGPCSAFLATFSR